MFGQGKTKRVRFHCACGQSLTATLRLLSRPFPCPACGRTLRTPRVQKSDTGWIVRFGCPQCNARTSAPISLHGATVPCRNCQRPVAVPEVFEGESPAAAHKPPGDLPIYAQPTMDLPAVGSAPPEETPPEPAPAPTPAAPQPEGRTALLRRVMSEEADRLDEVRADVPLRASASFALSPIPCVASAGALLVLIAGFLPWLPSPAGTLSFLALVTQPPARDALPAPVLIAALYYAWIGLVLAAAWFCRDPGRRGALLWALFLAAVVGLAVGRTLLPPDVLGPPRAGLYLAALGALGIAVVGALSLWNSLARLGLSVLLTLLAAAAVIGSVTDWFGLTRERLALKAVVAYEEEASTGRAVAAINLVIRNQGRKPVIIVAEDAAPADPAAPRPWRPALEREVSGGWKDVPLPLAERLPATLEPGKDVALALRLAPVWDLTHPGSDALPSGTETLAGRYRLRLESSGRAVVRSFNVAGLPHPEVVAAALLAQAQAAEKAGRLGDALDIYETLSEKHPASAAAPAAAQAMTRIGGDARDEREMKRVQAAILLIRKLEDEHAVARKNRPPDRDDGRIIPGVEKMDADIQILAGRIAQARQDLWRLLDRKAERAALDGRYEEALRAIALLQDQKPDAHYTQRAEALRADTVRRAAEHATRDGLAQVNALLAQDRLPAALAAARALRRGDIPRTAGSNDVRLAAETLYQRKCDEVEARLRELPCARRARLIETFLEASPDLAPDLRAEFALEMKNALAREEKARELVARVESLRPQTAAWYEALKTLLDSCPDTEAAAPLLPRKAAVEAWYKDRPR